MKAITSVIVGAVFLLLAVVPGTAAADGEQEIKHWQCLWTNREPDFPYECEMVNGTVDAPCLIVWYDDDVDEYFPSDLNGGDPNTKPNYNNCLKS